MEEQHQEANQAVMDSFIKKSVILKKYFKERSTDKASVARRQGCDWCDRFEELDYHVCINCGVKLD